MGKIPPLEWGNPLQYSCLENPHGQRSLAGHSPWGCKELDTTEQLTTHFQQTVAVCPSVIYSSREVRLSLPLESNPQSCLPVTGLAVVTAAAPPFIYTETCVRLRGGEASGTTLHLPGSRLATVPRAEAEAAGLGSIHLSAAALQHQPIWELSAPFSYWTSHGCPQSFAKLPRVLCLHAAQPALCPNTGSADQGQPWSNFVRARRILL